MDTGAAAPVLEATCVAVQCPERAGAQSVLRPLDTSLSSCVPRSAHQVGERLQEGGGLCPVLQDPPGEGVL